MIPTFSLYNSIIFHEDYDNYFFYDDDSFTRKKSRLTHVVSSAIGLPQHKKNLEVCKSD
jgi:hypothetical protein